MFDIIDFLLDDLNSENEMVRIDAIRQLAELPNISEKIVNKAQQILQNPNEIAEVKFFANQIILKYNHKEHNFKEIKYNSLEELENLVQNFSEQELYATVCRCNKEIANDLIKIYIYKIANNQPIDEKILTNILLLIKKYGSYTDATHIVKYLSSKNPIIAIETINVIEKLAPQILLENINSAILNQCIPVQNRAIRAILKLNFKLGYEYLRKLLFSNNPSIRASAVLQCFTIPFHKIQHLIYDLISKEIDPKVLHRTAYLLYINPSEHSVWKLLEIESNSSESKKDWCRTCVEKILESIKLSGVLKESTEEFIANIKQKLKQNSQNTMLTVLFDELANPDPYRRFEAVETLRQYKNLPEVKEKLTQIWFTEKDKRIKSLLSTILYNKDIKPKLEEKLDLKYFSKITKEEQLEILSQIDTLEAFITARDYIHKIVAINFDPMVIAQAIHILGKFGDETRELQPLLVALKAKNGIIQSKALEGIAKITPNYLYNNFTKIFKNLEPNAKVTAIKIFLNYDQEKALAALKEMLFSDSSIIKEQAILCMSQIGYPLIRNMLINFIESENSLVLIKKASSIIKNNPDLEAINILYISYYTSLGDRKKIMLDIIKECIQSYISAGFIKTSLEETLANLEKSHIG